VLLTCDNSNERALPSTWFLQWSSMRVRTLTVVDASGATPAGAAAPSSRAFAAYDTTYGAFAASSARTSQISGRPAAPTARMNLN
jgi:hypothetical protein